MLVALVLTLTLGVVWLAVLGGGAILMWRGLRGEPIDNEPRCRRCRYNVGRRRNLPYRCPECGANLQLLGSVRLGVRRPRGAHVAWGAALTLVGLSPIGVLIWRSLPRAVPAAVAALPAAAPAPTPRPVWNLAASRRAKTFGRVRAGAAAEAITRTVRLIPAPAETRSDLAAKTTIDIDALFDLIEQRRQRRPDYGTVLHDEQTGPPLFHVDLLSGAADIAVDSGLLRLAPLRSASLGSGSLEAGFDSRGAPTTPPRAFLPTTSNPASGAFPPSGPFAVVGEETAMWSGSRRAFGAQRIGSGILSGGLRLDGFLRPTLVVGGGVGNPASGFGGRIAPWRGDQSGSGLPPGIYGVPGAVPGGSNAAFSGVGPGLGTDLRLTQPLPTSSVLPSLRLGR